MVKKRQLEILVEALNARVGSNKFALDWAYGRPRLVESNGSRDVSPRLPKGEMAEWLWAFMAGWDYCKLQNEKKG